MRPKTSNARRYFSSAFFLFIFLLPVFLSGAPATAQSPAPSGLAAPGEKGTAMWLSQKDKNDLRAIEKYLNAITTLDARFLQITSLGEFAEGRLSMSRPGRLRIDYDDPNPVLIIANHGTIKYVDRELDQISYFPLDETPAGLLLNEKVRLLSDDILITDIERTAAAIHVSLRRTEDPRQGEITLSFSTKPLKLIKWDVVDARGLLTAVALQGARFGVPLKDDLFKYDAPKVSGPRS